MPLTLTDKVSIWLGGIVSEAGFLSPAQSPKGIISNFRVLLSRHKPQKGQAKIARSQQVAIYFSEGFERLIEILTKLSASYGKGANYLQNPEAQKEDLAFILNAWAHAFALMQGQMIQKDTVSQLVDGLDTYKQAVIAFTSSVEEVSSDAFVAWNQTEGKKIVEEKIFPALQQLPMPELLTMLCEAWTNGNLPTDGLLEAQGESLLEIIKKTPAYLHLTQGLSDFLLGLHAAAEPGKKASDKITMFTPKVSRFVQTEYRDDYQRYHQLIGEYLHDFAEVVKETPKPKKVVKRKIRHKHHKKEHHHTHQEAHLEAMIQGMKVTQDVMIDQDETEDQRKTLIFRQTVVSEENTEAKQEKAAKTEKLTPS